MPFPIHIIDPEWVLEPEQLGTKRKFWIHADDGGDFSKADWLFKYPTTGTGQHWAEKIACEIAKELNILTPRVELAKINGEIGTITENFTKDGYDLFHGNQILASFDPDYEREQRFRQHDHTLGRIFDAITALFRSEEYAEKIKEKLAGYLILDALICNVDRHHENWGILRKTVPEGKIGRLAPSYDHASSLGRELQDSDSKQNRHRYLNELGVGKYIERGHGPIFIDGTGKRGPSPLRLIQRCLEIEELSVYFKGALPMLERVNAETFQNIINETPEGMMSDLAKEFTHSLLCTTHTELSVLV